MVKKHTSSRRDSEKAHTHEPLKTSAEDQSIKSTHQTALKESITTAPKKHRVLRDFLGFLVLLLCAFFVSWLLITYFFAQYEVDGPSMQPTLHTGNRLVVLKIARTWSRITGHPYIPKRGDIVIFSETNLYNLNEVDSSQLVKRVIGLPGDRVVVKNGVITIYNKQHPKGFRPDATLPYGKVIGYTPDTLNTVVPQGDVFVCGDNRVDSLDSRIFGPVPVKYIVGQLVLRITPISQIKVF